MKPINGSVASLYDQVEKHVRPWINIHNEMHDDNAKKSQSHISLHKLKQSLEKLLLEQN
jgi:hypothetical protein